MKLMGESDKLSDERGEIKGRNVMGSDQMG